MPCPEGTLRTHRGVRQKCIGGEWVDVPHAPPESAGLISAWREITRFEDLQDQDLKAAVESSDKRVILHIEEVPDNDG
jgi:hypothetical protein